MAIIATPAYTCSQQEALYSVPRVCRECDEYIEPVALPYATDDTSGWFLACPSCHYVYANLDAKWFDVDPREAAEE